jgi:thymidylate kinase
MRSSGPFIGLIGPDGSGKTTLADAIRERCAAADIRFFYVHWRPSILRALPVQPRSGPPVPKRASPSTVTTADRALSLLRILRSAAVFNASYLCRVRPRLRAGAVVVADRWVYNYVGQPWSVRYHASPRLAGFVCRYLVIRPRYLFVLDGDPDEIAQRKNEVTAEEVRDELERIRAELGRMNLRALRIDRSPVQLADEVVNQLLGCEI